jgi:hypothetical protein
MALQQLTEEGEDSEEEVVDVQGEGGSLFGGNEGEGEKSERGEGKSERSEGEEPPPLELEDSQELKRRIFPEDVVEVS